MKCVYVASIVGWISLLGLCVFAGNDECTLHLGEKEDNGDSPHHRRLVTVNLPESCESSKVVSIDDPIDGINKSFRMVKSIPRTQEHGRHMLAMEAEKNYGYWYGEDEIDGSTFNYVQDEEGNMLGSMVDMTKDAVMQFVIEEGVPVVKVTKSSDFGEEVHPDEHEHGYFEDKEEHKQRARMLKSSSQVSGEQLKNEQLVLTPNSASTSHIRKTTSRSLYDDSGSNIDIVVVWTQAAECKNFGMSANCEPNRLTEIGMKNLVKLAVEETNTAYELSGVDTELLAVHSYRHPTFEEKTYNSFAAMLTALKNGRVSGVHEMRERYGGDLVALLVDDARYCGVGFVGPSKDWMFSVISWSCATGYFSFAHEVGHNLGLEHDRGSADACNDRENYNYGYRDPKGRFRSILAYGCRRDQCDNNSANGFCTRVQRFSNPNTKFNGQPIGTRTEDNARKLNEVKAHVAKYFPHKDPTQQPTSSPLAPVTKSPTKDPTPSPTNLPTNLPTESPTKLHTKAPTESPIIPPTQAPVAGIGTNVALGMPTWQTSTADGASSSRAVDGNISGNYAKGSVTQTLQSDDPSWSVLLLLTYEINLIKIYNRSDCCAERLSKLKITMWDHSEVVFIKNIPKPGALFSINLQGQGIKANRIELMLRGEDRILSLAEVEVFGTPVKVVPFTPLPPVTSPLITSSPTASSPSEPAATPTASTNLIPTESATSQKTAPTPVSSVGTNVALDKPTRQSSTYKGAVSSRAVDGIKNGDIEKGSVTHTKLSTSPSWTVQLMAKYAIHMIRIYNRNDCCQHRLLGFKIILWNNNEKSWTYSHGKSEVGDVVSVPVPPSIEADRVEVLLPGIFRVLSLAEVEVFGTSPEFAHVPVSPTASTKVLTKTPTKKPTDTPSKTAALSPIKAPSKSSRKSNGGNLGNNVALGKPTSQSSTRYGASSSRAVDGNTDGDFTKGSVTHTLHSTNPTWYVDFLASYKIDLIKIYNRVDCCDGRLRGFKVVLWNGNNEVWTYQHSGPKPKALTVLNVPGIVANRMIISIPGDLRVLNLAEVEVFGTPLKNFVQSNDSYSQTLPSTWRSPILVPGLKPMANPSPVPTEMQSFRPTELYSYEPTELHSYGPTEMRTSLPSTISSNHQTAAAPSQVSTSYATPVHPPRTIQTESPSNAPSPSVGPNIAYKKPTYQSSTAFKDVSSRAVDGDTNGYYENKSITQTYPSEGPSWTVDLMSHYNIAVIKIYNRLDCCMERLSGFQLNIWTGRDQVWTYTHDGVIPGAVTIVDVPSVSGDRVEIVLPGKERILSLAEVEIFASVNGSSPPTTGPVANVAKFKPTLQSSTAHDGVASRAVDGNRDGFWFHNSTTHTSHNTDPSWSVDLLAYYEIKQIKIYNRRDCCQNRIAGFHVLIWKDKEIVWTYVHKKSFAAARFFINVPPAVIGDKVEVKIPGKSKILSLAEVEVYGTFSDIILSS